MTSNLTQNLTRRGVLAGGLGAGAVTLLGTPSAAQTTGTGPRITRFEQAAPFPVNAYIVEGDDGLVVVDSTLTVTSSLALRAQIDATGKPLRAVLLTHAHPDHYAGLGNLTAGLDVPVISVAGVRDIALRDDAAKDALIGGMFGAEWPRNRVFPTEVVANGDTLDFGGGLTFTVQDIGPAESFHDSLFILDGGHQHVFAGDLAYALMHPYMADNTNSDWVRVLDRLQSDLAEDATLHVGHGRPVTPGFLQWQRDYIDIFEARLRAQDWSDPDKASAAVSAGMRDYLPGDALAFLMELSIRPNAERLGLL
ncbi:MBL fold metallo-hydrolase [Pseudooceanicola sp. C21-150M6]|uniref:MBL fold metallo-hydrolase n=1 Tax=Pseudooceanicola sp. C21-150M6 TaxID=3434355 RepID=UPI003D7FAC06